MRAGSWEERAEAGKSSVLRVAPVDNVDFDNRRMRELCQHAPCP